MFRQKLIPAAAVTAISALAVAGCGSSSSSSQASGAGGTKSSAAKPASSTSASPKSYGASGAGASTAAASGTAVPAAIITKHAKLGTILAYGPKKMTVYLFESDKAGASSCSAACAQVWPPVTGKPTASAGAQSAALGTIKRSDGTLQVTYKGHPLYRFIKDKDAGDAYGQGLKSFGAGWYVLKPSGAKLDES